MVCRFCNKSSTSQTNCPFCGAANFEAIAGNKKQEVLMNCPNCGHLCASPETCRNCRVTSVYHTEKCPNCGKGSPVYDRQLCSIPDGGCGYEKSEDAEHKSDPELPTCPKCAKQFPIFDGWDCRIEMTGCGYKVPEKRKKVVGRLLTNEEAAELRKKLGF